MLHWTLHRFKVPVHKAHRRQVNSCPNGLPRKIWKYSLKHSPIHECSVETSGYRIKLFTVSCLPFIHRGNWCVRGRMKESMDWRLRDPFSGSPRCLENEALPFCQAESSLYAEHIVSWVTAEQTPYWLEVFLFWAAELLSEAVFSLPSCFLPRPFSSLPLPTLHTRAVVSGQHHRDPFCLHISRDPALCPSSKFHVNSFKPSNMSRSEEVNRLTENVYRVSTLRRDPLLCMYLQGGLRPLHAIHSSFYYLSCHSYRCGGAEFVI